MHISLKSVCRGWCRAMWLMALGVLCHPLPAADHGTGAATEKKPAEAPAHGGEAKAAPEGGAEGGPGAGEKEGAGAEPQYQLAKPLNGYFDLTTLLPARKTSRYRYDIKDIMQTIGHDPPWMVKVSCSVEFGAETGLAELERQEAQIRDSIRQVIERYPSDELMTVAGKRRLKDDIIDTINIKLHTARVRDLYWTDFLMGQ